jgi:ferredoxin
MCFDLQKSAGASPGFVYIFVPMRIVHDKERCAAHGQCVGVAPELFKFADDGSLVVIDPHPPEQLREAAQDAVDICPKRALSIVED